MIFSIENSDFVCSLNQESLINPETNDKQLYMSFKLLKKRYKNSTGQVIEDKNDIEYFNHPYDPDNTIRLIDDLYNPESVSVESLENIFDENPYDKRGKKNAINRDEVMDHFFNPQNSFDFNNHMN